MKKLNVLYLFIITLLLSACGKDFLDAKVTNKVSAEALYGDEKGILAYLASIYQQLPIEDFNYKPRADFGFNTYAAGSHGGEYFLVATPDAVASRGFHIMYGKGGAQAPYWVEAYKLIRDINILEEAVPSIKTSVLSEAKKKSLIGEAAFCRAYTYFALAKRYGGVPLLTKTQDFSGNIEDLKLSRATEKETYDFILAQCDTAAKYLIPTEERRATKAAAWALKSRVALYAASITKYPVNNGSSEAYRQKLVDGMPSTAVANDYYTKCIEASLQIINPNADIGPTGHGLYMPNPASPAEAAANYQGLFENAQRARVEAIFIKGYTLPGVGTGHNWDLLMCTPQVSNGYNDGGTVNPTLDLIDLYETYTSNGASVPINTRNDNSLLYASPTANSQTQYRHFNDPQDIFAGKDARMFATIITPSSIWKNTKIISQAGLVRTDGTFIYRQDGSAVKNGTTYYSYGASSPTSYSGFNINSRYSLTGFFVKKYVVENNNPLPVSGSCTQDFIEMRYAEVLLNFAEAVLESGYTANNAQALATKAVNIIRKRAGHTYEIPSVTLAQVLRERRVEFGMENSYTLWDLIRRRQYHIIYNSFKHKVLCPVLDLTTTPVSYFFVRDISNKVSGTMTWGSGGDIRDYYLPIPGTGANGLIPNN
jgi:hypothetical protein